MGIVGAAQSLAVSFSLVSCHPPAAPVTLDGLDRPVIVAHRGGAMVYPESSFEAYKAVCETGFPLEMDLRGLSDKTLVPSHDEKVDRTMIGIDGNVADIGREEWLNALIPAPGSGIAGTPTTWEQILDEFGGKAVMVPELKEPSTDIDAFARTITERNLKDSVLVQTFDFDVSRDLASHGLHTLLLVKDGSTDPQKIAAAGISHVGPPKDIDSAYIQELHRAGIRIWPYTVNNSAEARDLLKVGVDGIFSNDPWKIQAELARSPS